MPAKQEQMSNRSFTMIKPDAFANGHSGAILDIILKAGFKLIALKMTHLTAKKPGNFMLYTVPVLFMGNS